MTASLRFIHRAIALRARWQWIFIGLLMLSAIFMFLGGEWFVHFTLALGMEQVLHHALVDLIAEE